ncbi:AcrR family transcriptional regulator [Allocatelliglobosispora scoriae]|uniref:AcrR family transcriptional regulator n=1 Tax=Allocatelliglobosispora scoriae TaxID=643052 RepID=A0A841BY36_9ACTN|nr:TetR/AcrR family transcriptional regulator [Allocatelliglobosispora scoriae]MBB5873074.1 AcrR family transcriptional regulator [Allocatelliglobosispora scoriae]
MGIDVPYEQTGRRQQKGRTRDALVTATRRLLAQGVTPTVEEAAAAADISRTTAYRYFPSQRSLLLAAHPQIDEESLLDADAPADAADRLEIVMRRFTDITVEWEPQLRTSLRLTLEESGGERPLLRQGRAIGWIADALAPLRESRPDVDVQRLAVAIRSATGIEALIWLTDIAGLDRADAARMMRWSARSMLRAALDGDQP